MRNRKLLDMRIAFIQRIVGRCDDIGKTKIQKICYFLQKAVGVELKYPFRIHYYGPYSDDVDDALSFAESLGFIDIEPDLDGWGYHVTPCKEESPWALTYDASTHRDIGRIDDAIDALGRLETYELELYATVHLVGGPESERSREQTIKTVKKLKPRFTHDRIDGAYQSLENAGLM